MTFQKHLQIQVPHSYTILTFGIGTFGAQAQKICFLPHFAPFSFFLLLFYIFHSKNVKKNISTSVCSAPKRWLKYTTEFLIKMHYYDTRTRTLAGINLDLNQNWNIWKEDFGIQIPMQM